MPSGQTSPQPTTPVSVVMRTRVDGSASMTRPPDITYVAVDVRELEVENVDAFDQHRRPVAPSTVVSGTTSYLGGPVSLTRG